ncbi:hypothetical protein BDZ89DRAFT_1069433 [Hymenopellis radicata]|nr:hypothetical protein BDZ89DRAFT_1069430 [Hymenopellis radicata]KAF9024049.1 hypothetical protein BDZ89DRAFT_1069433 [Hymenopellis radicata]
MLSQERSALRSPGLKVGYVLCSDDNDGGGGGRRAAKRKARDVGEDAGDAIHTSGKSPRVGSRRVKI